MASDFVKGFNGPRAARQQGEGHSEFRCVRCGYPVPELVMGCKDPCRNCRFLYPGGDCSD
jgi:hypothetical protein